MLTIVFVLISSVYLGDDIVGTWIYYVEPILGGRVYYKDVDIIRGYWFDCLD